MTTSSSTKRVYCVEDSVGIRERLFSEIAMIPGAELVGSAEQAVSATRDIIRLRPDLVVLDLNLAEGTGIEVLRGCRACVLATAFVVLTNHSDEITRDRTLRAGADAFFDKSTQFDEFLSHISALLNPQFPESSAK